MIEKGKVARLSQFLRVRVKKISDSFSEIVKKIEALEKVVFSQNEVCLFYSSNAFFTFLINHCLRRLIQNLK